jgi:hypothetical protein
MEPPRLYLAMDNCFASKRWARPREWMRVVRDLGVRYVEASADTECDPLYTVPEYLDEWTEEVASSEAETGCKVANLYTGHGTYSTLGLCHFDPRVSDHILRRWLVPMSAVAARLRAGFGFFCHAFSAAALRDRASHDQQMRRLLDRLVELSLAAAKHGASTLSIEQMYSPNQPPWTIAGSRALMREVWRRSRSPLYLTIDTGHQTGQKRYLRPDQAATQEILRRARAGEAIRGKWQGHGVGLAALERAAQESGSTGVDAVARMERAIAEHAYVFAGTEDADPYNWLADLACYSPIIHLQQTSGGSSSHAAFTPAHNRTGIIAAERVLQAIAASYAGSADRDMPPPCAHIYLTLELFFGPADYDEDVLAEVGQSIEYWRRFVPTDGLSLDQLAGGPRTV